jgi:AcrR family transcriptional regulator
MTRQRRTRQEQQEVTRQKLIHSAERLFARVGFEAASVEAIANDAGFSRGAFYSNFSTKEELLIEAFEALCRRMNDETEAILGRSQKADERYRALRSLYVKLASDPQGHALEAECQLCAARNPSFWPRFSKAQDAELHSLAKFLQRYLKERGVTPAVPPEDLALSLIAMSRGLRTYKMVQDSLSRKSIERILNLLFDSIMSGSPS